MTTISQSIESQVSLLRNKRSPRRKVLRWMRCNQNWFREAVALEWERQTGEDWTNMLRDAAYGA